MRTGRALARELALLAGVLVLLLGASIGIYRLLSSARLSAPRIEGRRAARLEEALRPLFRRALLLQAQVMEDPRVQRLTAAVVDRLQQAAGGDARDEDVGQGREGAAPAPVEVLVVDSPVVNAFALPGGLIAVHRGLLARLQGPEELAAIVAHEMGHAAHHDSLNGLARAFGLSLLLSLVTGGSENLTRNVLEQAFAMHYSRQAEERADRYALELLARARLDPARFAEALGRLESRAPSPLLRYLDTHPDIGSRIEAARRRSAEARPPAEPLAAEWPADLFAGPG